ncbi:facilitated trehalose transporter Tret1-2 homolog isoform X1 [Frankliniella occidentalis]|uniref:Facilitated trehalose transporter Tret1-2 homolog isoform X1 n=1 Tax=Frankliniella occidentalis TaxID=133901 RepID=A0A9C6TVB0_FRAOC|nr:facilitated trehalose transporter Tret1-2 homolog isoform X1 [Frankliniella occidentalis]
MGGGTVFTVNTMYWGEIASPGFRGSASSLTQAMLFLGVLLADVIGYLYPTEYTTLAYCGLAVTLLFLACFFPMPESPYFLLMRGRPDLARQSLQRLRGRDDVAGELVPLEESMRADLALGSDLQCGCVGMVRTGGARKALLIAVVVGALQRLSGLSAVIAYTSTTLPENLANFGPAIIGAVLFVASFAPLLLMDRLGRRPLLILSSIVVAASMTSNGLYFHFFPESEAAAADGSSLTWVPLLGLVVYAVAYALGMGPVPDILPGEVFPTSVKGLAVSGVNISLTIFTFLVSKIYNSAGAVVMYFSFAVAGVLTAFFTYFVIPETRGKTLEQVVAELEGRPAVASNNTPDVAAHSLSAYEDRTASNNAERSPAHLP